MKIVLTNLDTVAVPFSSPEGKGFTVMLEPGVPQALDLASVGVGSVGDNPTWREEIEQGFQALLDLITFWHKNKGIAPPHVINVRIDNQGTNGLRVLLGSNVEEVTVEAGTSYDATAPEYVEIRELGV